MTETTRRPWHNTTPTKKAIRAALAAQAPDGWKPPEKPKRRGKIKEDGEPLELSQNPREVID
jgi:hypothetical protein